MSAAIAINTNGRFTVSGLAISMCNGRENTVPKIDVTLESEWTWRNVGCIITEEVNVFKTIEPKAVRLLHSIQLL